MALRAGWGFVAKQKVFNENLNLLNYYISILKKRLDGCDIFLCFRFKFYFHYNLNFTNLNHFGLEIIKLQYQIKPKKD